MAARRNKPGGSAHIADKNEVLECLTTVLRGTDGEDGKITPRDRLRAAELLARRYCALEGEARQAEIPRIIDDIPKRADTGDGYE